MCFDPKRLSCSFENAVGIFADILLHGELQSQRSQKAARAPDDRRGAAAGSDRRRGGSDSPRRPGAGGPGIRIRLRRSKKKKSCTSRPQVAATSSAGAALESPERAHAMHTQPAGRAQQAGDRPARRQRPGMGPFRARSGTVRCPHKACGPCATGRGPTGQTTKCAVGRRADAREDVAPRGRGRALAEYAGIPLNGE